MSGTGNVFTGKCVSKWHKNMFRGNHVYVMLRISKSPHVLAKTTQVPVIANAITRNNLFHTQNNLKVIDDKQVTDE